MSKEAMKLALEAMERYQVKRQDFDRFADEITALREALEEPPAQQEPRIDIYRSFEQWKSGNVLEHGVPRTEFYTKADLDLVEMGWRYGYDAGRAVEQALDKMADNARELGLDYEPAQTSTYTCGVCGVSMQMEQQAQQEPVALEEYDAGLLNDFGGGNVYWWWDYIRAELGRAYEHYQSQMLSPPAQRPWVGLTDEDIVIILNNDYGGSRADCIRAAEARLKERNT